MKPQNETNEHKWKLVADEQLSFHVEVPETEYDSAKSAKLYRRDVFSGWKLIAHKTTAEAL